MSEPTPFPKKQSTRREAEPSRVAIVAPYRDMQQLGFIGMERDHVPSRAAIARFAKLRYDLVTPGDVAGEKDPETQGYYNRVFQERLWKRLDGYALSWSIPEELHAKSSRTYSSRSKTAAKDDMEAFKQFLLDQNAIPSAKATADISDAVAKLLMRRPSSGEDRPDYGQEYLVRSALADVAALEVPLKEKGYQQTDIDDARRAFVAHARVLDDKLAVMAKNQHELTAIPEPDPESANILESRIALAKDKATIADMLGYLNREYSENEPDAVVTDAQLAHPEKFKTYKDQVREHKLTMRRMFKDNDPPVPSR